MIDCDVMNIWNGTFTQDVTKDYRISICTVCMNRLNDIRLTLPANIEAERSYPDVEFVLLDYNSSDGLGDWVKSEMMEHIESGRLVYYRTEEPQFFNFSHSRNVAMCLAAGEIINNVDADNYTFNNLADKKPDECWTSYLNKMANDCPDRIMMARGKRVSHGRLGFYKSDFVDLLGGYDERITHYGQDQYDLIRRAWHLGFVMYWWGTMYFSRIYTEYRDRMINLDMSGYGSIKESVNSMRDIGTQNMADKVFRANAGREWGKANVTKNFTTRLEI